MSEEAIRRAEELKEALKTGHSTIKPGVMEEVKQTLYKVPDIIKEARKEQTIWCKDCYQEYPATSMKDFSCRICGSRQYQIVPPY